MKYLSVCSGIEAATMAWHPLGWSPVAFSEIDPFPSAVLAHRYPHIPNWGDMTQFEEWPDEPVDLLVGGTPCQDYSVAGKRLGMAGSRGQLTLTYIEIAARYRPRWLVWENVTGVLSSNEGRDFARFLGDLSGQSIEVPAGGWQNHGIVAGIPDAYGLAWCVRDAQYVRVDGFARAVPQRRRRVFVVGHLGDWRPSAAVCIEPEGMRGNPPPRREAGSGVAGALSASSGRRGGVDDPERGGLIASTGDVAHCLNAGGMGRQDYETETLVAFDTIQITSAANYSSPKPGDACHPLAAGAHAPAVATQWMVRRLTPVECERLQGFPDGFTDVPWRRRNRTPDGLRYKALGNSMAVNVMRAIGRRIEMVEAAL